MKHIEQCYLSSAARTGTDKNSTERERNFLLQILGD